MELYDQIRRISFSFFVIVGIAHFLAGLFFVNGYLVPLSGVVNRVSFIPFVIAALTYASSNSKYRLLEYGKDSKWWNWVFIGMGIAIFAALIALEFFAADSATPLRNQ